MPFQRLFIRSGIVCIRIDTAWVDADAEHLFSEITGCPVHLINDTDATGMAEMTFGVGKDIEALLC